ncbi:aquaporin-11 [Lepeophtheirus salmonis]|uniref:Aquaporin n=1 Tax=Lepeophtheirus salmonis TaxID=72036 RepID=A0A0K2E311_LEPSM|nr:aquaporin-11-like [Lepeophtheirus salmonis]ALA27403.1 aquaporin [Lepeophtheirus salmonis]
MAFIPCICVSLGSLCLTLAFAELLRLIIHASLKGGILKIALLEFVAAAELCGCGFELVIIADNYGISAYAICLFLLTIWWGTRWTDETACPYTHFEECLLGRMSSLETIVRTVAEIVGGLLVFKYIHFLWSIEFTETHVGRAHSASFNHCSSDLQVPVLYGALIEGVATMICRCTSKFLSDKKPHYASTIDSFVATSLVILAFDYSGGYYNPVLATGLKYGCKGHPLTDHILVYWIGASLGAIASIYIYPLLSDFNSKKSKVN